MRISTLHPSMYPTLLEYCRQWHRVMYCMWTSTDWTALLQYTGDIRTSTFVAIRSALCPVKYSSSFMIQSEYLHDLKLCYDSQVERGCYRCLLLYLGGSWSNLDQYSDYLFLGNVPQTFQPNVATVTQNRPRQLVTIISDTTSWIHKLKVIYLQGMRRSQQIHHSVCQLNTH